MSTRELVVPARSGSLAAISFGITFVRLGLAVYVALAYVAGLMNASATVAVGVLVIMALDYCDGVLFKRSLFNEVNKWRVRRRLLDSTIDRVVIQVVCIAVVWVRPEFLPFYLLIAVREMIFCSYALYQWSHRILVYPGSVARLNTVAVGLLVVAFLGGFAIPAVLLVAAILVLSPLALVEYRKSVAGLREGAEFELSTGAEFMAIRF